MPSLNGVGRIVEGETLIATKANYKISWDQDRIPVQTFGAGRQSLPGLKSNFKGTIELVGAGKKELDEEFKSRAMLTLELEGGLKLDFTLGSYDPQFEIYQIQPDPAKDFYR
jgi:hypothetical protein